LIIDEQGDTIKSYEEKAQKDMGDIEEFEKRIAALL